MKKKLLFSGILVCLLIFSFGLMGCPTDDDGGGGGGGGSSTTLALEDGTAGDNKILLKLTGGVWENLSQSQWDYGYVGYDSEYVKFYQNVVSLFDAAYPRTLTKVDDSTIEVAFGGQSNGSGLYLAYNGPILLKPDDYSGKIIGYSVTASGPVTLVIKDTASGE
jgi:hypothetical protein